jgi:hypothetical protein
MSCLLSGTVPYDLRLEYRVELELTPSASNPTVLDSTSWAPTRGYHPHHTPTNLTTRNPTTEQEVEGVTDPGVITGSVSTVTRQGTWPGTVPETEVVPHMGSSLIRDLVSTPVSWLFSWIASSPSIFCNSTSYISWEGLGVTLSNRFWNFYFFAMTKKRQILPANLLCTSNLVLYYTILYYTILYYTILYYTILYYTILSRPLPAMHFLAESFDTHLRVHPAISSRTRHKNLLQLQPERARGQGLPPKQRPRTRTKPAPLHGTWIPAASRSSCCSGTSSCHATSSWTSPSNDAGHAAYAR